MKDVLIIDVDEMVCRFIKTLAEQKGALATITKNEDEARNALNSGIKFNVIFVDLIIPYISGWDILTVIKNDPATKNTPVVIMTGGSMFNEEIERLRGKVFAIIDKRTFKKEEFEEILNKLI